MPKVLIYNYEDIETCLQRNPYNRSKFEVIKYIIDKFDCYLAGGAARQLFMGEEFGSTDIDLYCTHKAYAKATSFFKYYFIRTSSYAKTIEYSGFKIQLIPLIEQVEEVEGAIFVPKDNNKLKILQDILIGFDFYCCMFGYIDNKIYYHSKSVPDVLKKELWFNENYKNRFGFADRRAYNNDLNFDHIFKRKSIDYPFIYRILKYMKKGYIPKGICLDQLKELLLDLDKYDLSYILERT